MNTHKYLDRHGNPIDVYAYPEGADHQAMRDYQHAVEVAHQRDGLCVETYHAAAMDWRPVTPSFRWDYYRYRITPPKIAEGHNPDQLTEDQVGVSEGWRLLAPEEIAARPAAKDTECWSDFGPKRVGWKTWRYAGSDYPAGTFRTKKPVGFFRPTETNKLETDDEALDRIWRRGLTRRLLDARSKIWRNLPNGPTTFSRCECDRGNGRGGGPCIKCAEEALAKLVGDTEAAAYVATVRRVRDLESGQEMLLTNVEGQGRPA